VSGTVLAAAPRRFSLGDVVVLKGYETGWRWCVADARLSKSRRSRAVWVYRLETKRPYDGKAVECRFPEWKLRLPQDPQEQDRPLYAGTPVRDEIERDS
jgi:hypothetical protein